MAEKKQIDGMARLMCKFYADDPNCRRCPNCWVRDVAKVLYEAGYRKQEWISVKDALPEDEQTVLTIDTEREMQVCFYETAQKGVFQLFHGLVSVYNITHWMPLPQPPKGE